MARKKKENEQLDSEPAIESSPEANVVDEVHHTAEEVKPRSSNLDSIDSEAQAVEFVRNNYQVPETVKIVYVTSDKQVFYRKNSASAYQNENKNVKLFAISWD